MGLDIGGCFYFYFCFLFVLLFVCFWGFLLLFWCCFFFSGLDGWVFGLFVCVVVFCYIISFVSCCNYVIVCACLNTVWSEM